MKADTLLVIKLAIVCFIIICLYGKYRCENPNYHDPLMNKIGIGDLDGWSISHFLFFALIGYLCPDKFWLSMGFGVAWEGFEHILGQSRPGFLGGFGDCITTDPNVLGPWWFGRISDIILNTSGFIVGSYLKRSLIL